MWASSQRRPIPPSRPPGRSDAANPQVSSPSSGTSLSHLNLTWRVPTCATGLWDITWCRRCEPQTFCDQVLFTKGIRILHFSWSEYRTVIRQWSRCWTIYVTSFSVFHTEVTVRLYMGIQTFYLHKIDLVYVGADSIMLKWFNKIHVIAFPFQIYVTESLHENIPLSLQMSLLLAPI